MSSKSRENTGRWSKAEHDIFIKGLRTHGKEWKVIAAMVETRTVVQIRTHAQKYFQKLSKLGITDPIADIREGRIPPFNGTKRPRGEGAAPPHSPLVTPRTASSRRGRPRAASAPNPHPHRMYMDGDTSDGMAEDGEEEEEGPGQPNHTVRLGAPPRGAAIPSSSATSSSLRRQAALHRSKGRGSNGHGHGHGHGLGHGSSGGGVGIPASPITGTGTGRTTTTTTTTTTARQAPPVPPRRGTNSVRFAVPPESGGLGRPSTSRFRRRSPASMAASSAGPRVFHSARRRRTQRAWSMDDDALMGRAADEAVPLLPSVPVVELPPSLQDPPQHTVFVQLAGVSEYGDNSSCASYYGVDTSYPHDEAMGAADGALPGLLALQNNGSPTGVTDNFFFGSHAKAQDDGRISPVPPGTGMLHSGWADDSPFASAKAMNGTLFTSRVARTGKRQRTAYASSHIRHPVTHRGAANKDFDVDAFVDGLLAAH